MSYLANLVSPAATRVAVPISVPATAGAIPAMEVHAEVAAAEPAGAPSIHVAPAEHRSVLPARREAASVVGGDTLAVALAWVASGRRHEAADLSSLDGVDAERETPAQHGATDALHANSAARTSEGAAPKNRRPSPVPASVPLAPARPVETPHVASVDRLDGQEASFIETDLPGRLVEATRKDSSRPLGVVATTTAVPFPSAPASRAINAREVAVAKPPVQVRIGSIELTVVSPPPAPTVAPTQPGVATLPPPPAPAARSPAASLPFSARRHHLRWS